MNKYFSVVKIALKNALTYRFDILGSTLFSFFSLLLLYILWGGIYNKVQQIAGFSFEMMITYYILVNFLKRLDTSDMIAKELAEEIKTGKFTKYLIKPISVLGYYFSRNIAMFIFIFVFNMIGTVLWSLIFSEYFCIGSISNIFYSIFISLLGLFFTALLNFAFVLLTFKLIDVSAFFMIKDNIIAFITGTLIPLNVLPQNIIEIFKYTPFYYIYYYPITLYLGTEEVTVFNALIIMFIWCFILLLFINIMYHRVVKIYEGVGF